MFGGRFNIKYLNCFMECKPCHIKFITQNTIVFIQHDHVEIAKTHFICF